MRIVLQSTDLGGKETGIQEIQENGCFQDWEDETGQHENVIDMPGAAYIMAVLFSDAFY